MRLRTAVRRDRTTNSRDRIFIPTRQEATKIGDFFALYSARGFRIQRRFEFNGFARTVSPLRQTG
jgi:hypothetical protein